MKIKAFSFERDSLTLAQQKGAVLDLLGGGIYFDSISDPNLLFTKISEAVSDSDVILIGVESSLYLKFKPILIRAFHFTPAFSEAIEERIKGGVSDETLKKAHMLVPNESTELLTDDGLFSGFYVESEGQYIVVFPLRKGVVPEILASSGLPFFVSEEQSEATFDEILSPDASSKKAQRLVDKLVSNGLKLAVPTTSASSVLKDDIKGCTGFEDNIFFTPFVNDTGMEDPKAYSAQLSRGAMELRSADLGATISDLQEEKEGDDVTNICCYISVATTDKAVIRRLFADSDESRDHLIAEATNELYTMIDKYADEVLFKKNASAEELEKYEQAMVEEEFKAEERPVGTIGKKGTIITIIILIIALAICVLLGFKFSGFFITPTETTDTTTAQAGLTQILPTNPANDNEMTDSSVTTTAAPSSTGVTVSAQAATTTKAAAPVNANPETTRRREIVTTTRKQTTTKKETTAPTKPQTPIETKEM